MRPALVCLFLRGGADGLALVPPHADPHLRELRPTLASPPPGKGDDAVIDIDGRFGLHPALQALVPAFDARELAIVHAVGSDDDTRSHFEAQDRMELAGETASSASGGWLARHLSTRPGPRAGPLAAVAFGARPPEALRGTAATALERVADFPVPGLTPAMATSIASLYQAERDARRPLATDLAAAGRAALRAADQLAAFVRNGAPGVEPYPATTLGRHRAEAAFLLKRREALGVEVVTIDHQGWDTHFVQSTVLPPLVRDLADGLAAFRADLGDAMQNIVVVVMTEFGRRAHENVSLGTDHGRASVMFVLGGRVNGGRVYGDFPGLGAEALAGPGDLRVTTDYRSVLAEVLAGPFRNPHTGEVFPGAPSKTLGLVA